MKGSKLTELFKTFSPAEFRDLEKFLLSPYFRKRDVIGLFNVLKAFYPEYKDENLSNEFVFAKLYPGKKTDKQKTDSLIRTLSSVLYKACMEYLVQIELNEQSSFKNYFLLTQLRKRKLYDEFKRKYQEFDKDDMDQKIGLYGTYLEKSYICEAAIAFHLERSEFEKAIENVIKQIEYMIAATTIKSFLFPTQKEAAEAYNLKVRYNLVENFSKHLDTKSLLAEMKDNNDFFASYFEPYYYTNQIILNPSDKKNYYALKELLMKKSLNLPQSEKYMFFCTIFSYYIAYLKKEALRFDKELFEIYDSMIQQGAYKYSKGDHITPVVFRNMLVEARLCREFGWMKIFIDNFINELHPDIRENMKHYSYGQYYFGIGENEKALESLVRLKSVYFLYKKDVKNLLFMIYYNLEYFEQAYSVLDTIKHYINSTKDFSEELKSGSRNFIKFASELLRIRMGTKKSNPSFLYEKIKKENDTESYYWLMEKAEELKLIAV